MTVASSKERDEFKNTGNEEEEEKKKKIEVERDMVAVSGEVVLGPMHIAVCHDGRAVTSAPSSALCTQHQSSVH